MPESCSARPVRRRTLSRPSASKAGHRNRWSRWLKLATALRSFRLRSGSTRLELKFPDWPMEYDRWGHGRTQSGTLAVFCRRTPKALSMCSRITPKLHIRGTSWAISPAPCPDLRRSDVLLLALETCFQIESSLALQQARSFEARVLRPTQSWTPAREQ